MAESNRAGRWGVSNDIAIGISILLNKYSLSFFAPWLLNIHQIGEWASEKLLFFFYFFYFYLFFWYGFIFGVHAFFAFFPLFFSPSFFFCNISRGIIIFRLVQMVHLFMVSCTLFFFPLFEQLLVLVFMFLCHNKTTCSGGYGKCTLCLLGLQLEDWG